MTDAERNIAIHLNVVANMRLAAAYGVSYSAYWFERPVKITIGGDGRGTVVSTGALTHERRRTHHW